jgi:hypothetical protein
MGKNVVAFGIFYSQAIDKKGNGEYMKKINLLLVSSLVLQSAFGFSQSASEEALKTVSGSGSGGLNSGITQPAPVPSDAVLVAHKITTLSAISDVLKNVYENTYAYPLQSMIAEATTIIANANPLDYGPHYVLKKATTVVDQTIRNAGYNEDFLGAFFQSYMRVSYELGAQFLRTPGCSAMTPEKVYVSIDYELCTRSVPNHVVALRVAQDLWKYSASLITSTAEAVMIIHALDALKMGINDNVYRANSSFQDLYVKLDKIEKQNWSYQNMVKAIADYQEPEEQDVNNVRYELLKIFEQVPQMLAVK